MHDVHARRGSCPSRWKLPFNCWTRQSSCGCNGLEIQAGTCAAPCGTPWRDGRSYLLTIISPIVGVHVFLHFLLHFLFNGHFSCGRQLPSERPRHQVRSLAPPGGSGCGLPTTRGPSGTGQRASLFLHHPRGLHPPSLFPNLTVSKSHLRGLPE